MNKPQKPIAPELRMIKEFKWSEIWTKLKRKLPELFSGLFWVLIVWIFTNKEYEFTAFEIFTVYLLGVIEYKLNEVVLFKITKSETIVK